MLRRILLFFALAALAFSLAACHNKKVQNPLANVGSKQPDKVLFDRAMQQMKSNHMDQARLILQTLINTYPDSEYIARAKLAVGDSWYAEGGAAALAQAENEYKDFETFFPNMPEAAEAQLKIANIHYRQMEKPDRDFTHALRAQEEYRYLINQYPDTKLVPEAKQRLREVQEVLAEREYRVGRFYYMREAWPATIARLESLVDEYPLYSGADDALFLLGDAYERQIEAIRASRLPEAAKGTLIKQFTDKAATAYDRIITRYPATDRAKNARERLQALHRPVPTPTAAAIAENKKEEESRTELGSFAKMMLNLHRKPDVSQAAHVGDPTLVDAKQVSAPDIVRQNNQALVAAATGKGGANTVSVETVNTGQPPPSQPVPRSDAQPASAPGDAGDGAIPELRPNVPQDSGTPAPTPVPPAQMNEAAGAPPAPAQADTGANSSSNASAQETDKNVSTSKKKKKKGLGKLIPF